MREKTNSMSSQKFRNRLFVIWFNNYENRHKYVLKTAEGKLEGQDNIALIAQVDNPRLAQAVEEFEETADILFGPPAKQHLSFWEKCIEFVCKIFSKVI